SQVYESSHGYFSFVPVVAGFSCSWDGAAGVVRAGVRGASGRLRVTAGSENSTSMGRNFDSADRSAEDASTGWKPVGAVSFLAMGVPPGFMAERPPGGCAEGVMGRDIPATPGRTTGAG